MSFEYFSPNNFFERSNILQENGEMFFAKHEHLEDGIILRQNWI